MSADSFSSVNLGHFWISFWNLSKITKYHKVLVVFLSLFLLQIYSKICFHTDDITKTSLCFVSYRHEWVTGRYFLSCCGITLQTASMKGSRCCWNLQPLLLVLIAGGRVPAIFICCVRDRVFPTPDLVPATSNIYFYRPSPTRWWTEYITSLARGSKKSS